jgi:flagellar protein FlgJ
MDHFQMNAPLRQSRFPIDPQTTGQNQTGKKNADLMKAAQSLEASFLSEMLTAAGLGQSRQGFGGGAGEDQFSSFLVQEQASAIVQAGGIGLSEMIFQTLKERRNDA